LTAVISDAGSVLQPVAKKRESVRAKNNSGLHLIAAVYPFKRLPILSVLYFIPVDNAMN
jgi:hypothetical protein